MIISKKGGLIITRYFVYLFLILLSLFNSCKFELSYLERKAPSVFSIKGITGLIDSTYDNLLKGGNVPTVSWTSSSDQTSYEITIFENDGVNVACSKVNVQKSSNSHAFSGCSLTQGKTYKVNLIAKNSLHEIEASNNNFIFLVAPTLSVGSIQVDEDDPAGYAVFTVTLSSPSDWDTSFNFETSDGTAFSSGIFQDYISALGSETILAGETIKTISVPIIDDCRDEADFEDFYLTILNPSNATISSAIGTATIINDDAPPAISISDSIPVEEGEDMIFAVTLNCMSEKTITFNWSGQDITTTFGVDYPEDSGGPIIIEPGIVSMNLNIPTTHDIEFCEETEYLEITLEDFSNALPVEITTIGTILEKDLPTFIVNDVTILEGSKGNFQISLSEACPLHPVTVTWKTLSASATVGEDLEAITDTIVFPPGETISNFSVQTYEDDIPELIEYFNIGLLSAINGRIPGSQIGRGFIQDNDSSENITVIKATRGTYHTCALLSNRKIKCWGSKDSGVLGIPFPNLGDDNDEMGDNLPFIDIGTYRTVVSISQGTHHSCAVLDDGAVKCWGSSSSGRLGLSPGYVNKGDKGDNPGEMGDNLQKVDLENGLTAVKVTSGSLFNCVLFSNGKVKCFGSNSNGELGLGNTWGRFYTNEMGSNLPFVDLGGGRTVKDIVSGSNHTCAILDDDSLKCWGRNYSGVLGQGHSDNIGSGLNQMGDNLPPVNLGTGRTVKDISAGGNFNCAILDNDRIKCWGYNWYGNLGYGDNSSRGSNINHMGDNLPYVNLGDGKLVSKISLSFDSACTILLGDNSVKCWGYNGYGNLGQGHTSSRGTNIDHMGDNLSFTYLGEGRSAKEFVGYYEGFCAILDDDSLKCWGRNHVGQLGQSHTINIGTSVGQMEALLPIDLGSGVVPLKLPSNSLSSSPCIISHSGKVKCWGWAASGILGKGDIYTGDEPGEMGVNLEEVNLGTDLSPIDISSGPNHNCVLFDNGKVKCWGRGSYGRLGLGNSNDCPTQTDQMGDNLPFVDIDSTRRVIKISAGGDHTCALLEDNFVKCWGRNSYGQLGLGHSNTIGTSSSHMGDNLPIVDLGTNLTAIDIAAGDNYTCALLDDMSIKCWGYNNQGQLGQGHTSNLGTSSSHMGDNLPRVNLGENKKVQEISLGGAHICALLIDGDIKCWGRNIYGQLGQGHTSTVGTSSSHMGDNLQSVILGSDKKAIALPKNNALSTHMCAILNDNTLKCWGENFLGQLGIGTTSNMGGYISSIGDNLSSVSLGRGLWAKEVLISTVGSCAILNDGSLKCWGENNSGSCGQGHNSDIGSLPSQMGNQLPPIDLGGIPHTLGDFAIKGVTGGLDTVEDEWLGHTELTVHFEASENATNYKVTVFEMNMTDVKCAEVDTAGTTYSFIGCTLDDGNSYRIKVVADNGADFRAAANNNFVFTVDQTAPENFSILGITGGGDSINNDILSDGLFATVNFTGSIGSLYYEITIYETNGVDVKCPMEVSPSGSLSFSFDSCPLTNGESYKLEIIAFDLVGNSKGATNNPFNFSVTDTIEPQEFSVLGITGGSDTILNNVLSSGSWATVHWEDTVGENSYDITICEDSGCAIEKCSTTNVPLDTVKYSFAECELENSNTYWAKVVAIDTFSNTDAVNSPYAFTVENDGPGSFKVLGVTGGISDNTADNQLTSGNAPDVYWEGAQNAVNYEVTIYRENGFVKECPTVNTALLSYNFTDCYLRAGKIYEIRLVAYDNESRSIEAFNSPFAFHVDDYPQVNIDNPEVAEGSNLVFTVTLSKVWDENVTLKWKTVPLTATPGIDYEVSSGTVTITAGNLTNDTDISIPTINDSQPELDEKLIVSLTEPFNARLANQSIGIGTIKDNDAGVKVVKVENGSYYSCALLSDGNAKCWGMNNNGQLRELMPNVGWLPGDMGENLSAVDLGSGQSAYFVAGNTTSTCAVLANGNVKCWGGGNWTRQLGWATSQNIGDNPGEMGDNIPSINFGEPVIQIVGGYYHYCVLLESGNVKCWGYNNRGQLGYGDTTSRYANDLPNVDLGTGRTALKISAGYWHNCALLDNNTVKCWGSNTSGELGQGHTSDIGTQNIHMGDNLLPLDFGSEHIIEDDEIVETIPHNAIDISSGANFNCAILNTNDLKCWGDNWYGQLGQGHTSPIGSSINHMGNNLQVTDFGSGRTVKKVSAGYLNSCAILDNDFVKCWGLASYGALGQGFISSRGSSPSHMGDNLSYVNLGASGTAYLTGTDLYSGVYFNCARLSTGEHKCWGYNYYGQLGTENTINYGSSTNQMGDDLPVLDVGSEIVNLMAGVSISHQCAVLETGDLKCWGRDDYGQLGNGNFNNMGDQPGEMGINRPYIDFGSGLSVLDLSVGSNHACVLLNTHEVKCWGVNSYGRLGRGNSDSFGGFPEDNGESWKTVSLDPDVKPIKVVAGGDVTCVMYDDFSLSCFGFNYYGQLGLGHTSIRGIYETHMGSNLSKVDLGQDRYTINISVGGDHSCALLDNFKIKCWGRNNYGKLGYEHSSTLGDDSGEMGDNLPFVDLGNGMGALQVIAGNHHSCAVLETQGVKCWGRNNYFQLGLGLPSETVLGNTPGDMGDNLNPIDIGENVAVLQLKTFLWGYSNCALMDINGTIGQKCWGEGSLGILGQGNAASIGSTVDQIANLNPVDLGSGRTPVNVSVGRYHTCSVLDNGELKCWGYNEYGQLGYEDVTTRGSAPGQMGDNLPYVDLGL